MMRRIEYVLVLKLDIGFNKVLLLVFLSCFEKLSISLIHTNAQNAIKINLCGGV